MRAASGDETLAFKAEPLARLYRDRDLRRRGQALPRLMSAVMWQESEPGEAAPARIKALFTSAL